MSTIRKPMILGGVLAILLVSVVIGMVACGGSSKTTTTKLTSSSEPSSSGGSTTTAAFTGDAATIVANWIKFFDGSQPASGKAALLENGTQYTQQIQGFAAFAKTAKAQVSAITITSSTSADVTYTLIFNGTPVLTNQQGKAVLQDGTWKVSAQTFQALLAMAQQTSTTAK